MQVHFTNVCLLEITITIKLTLVNNYDKSKLLNKIYGALDLCFYGNMDSPQRIVGYRPT